MFSNAVSPQKRKHLSEYHDPDYVRLHLSPYKKMRDSDSNKIHENEFLTFTNSRLKSISDIISHEFQKEISLKREQLTEIEKRLNQACSLLERLRFVIVSDYYQKQELSISAGDATAVRGKETLFEKEPEGPQMALHPSFKNVIKKKSINIYDVSQRPLPERAAAQNALSTIRARSTAQKRQDRRLQQLIKEQGLVIDHSKEKEVQMVEAGGSFDQTKSQDIKVTDIQSPIRAKMPTKSLNSNRLNNKTKHLIVIGNTSTYIGGDVDNGTELKISGENMLTHKWLVYVQSKDPKINLESFLKKVRFHLHSSYRPNDIVDVRTAPFQIARRGWGEFPMRIQLFFQEHIQQKPVQLIHNVVLDRTLSGMHTLGSETLMEIWLRSDITFSKAKHEPSFVITTNSCDNMELRKLENSIKSVEKDHGSITKKHRTISFTHNKEELDDSLFGFLNKTEAVSADITKIEPSVVVNEQLAKISSNSPIKIICKSPEKCESLSSNEMGCSALSKDKEENSCAHSSLNTTTVNDQEIVSKNILVSHPSTSNNTNTQSNISNPMYPKVNIKSTNTNSEINKEVATTIKGAKAMQLTTPMIMRLPTTNTAGTHQTSNINKNNNNIIALSKVGKFMPLKTTITNEFSPNNNSAFSNMCAKNPSGKAVLQKKLVQLVDGEGKIKFMQVLVATMQTTGADTKIGTSRNETVNSPKNAVCASSVTTNTTPFIQSSTTTPENDIPLELTLSKDITPTNLFVTNNNCKLNSTNNIYNSKNNTNAVNSPKQMVFQKEGKLFIIDPLQMKLKQERNKQVSLLKPQTNLQRQQQRQMQNHKVQSKALHCMISDHDYTHSLINISKCNINLSNPGIISGSIKSQIPELHLGIRQTRAKATNAFELLQQRRIQFEEGFMKQKINTMRSAIDYILRHLPLIAPKNSLAAAFSFVSNSYKEFDTMTVLKQRACEWLRAKYIARFVRNHKYLKELNSNNKEQFWSTREVLIYARYHAFTAKMKLFDVMTFSPRSAAQNLSRIKDQEAYLSQEHNFSQFLKSEVKSEQKYIQYESITPKHRIISWLDYGCKELINDETGVEDSEETIDIVGVPMSSNRSKFNIENLWSNQQNNCEKQQHLYLPIPDHLEQSSQLVSDICRDINIQLQPEQVEKYVKFPLAQAVLSQCLNTFIEKIIRRAVALKINQPTHDSLNVTTHDIGKVLVRHAEFDFLTNKYLGTYKNDIG